MTQTLQYRHYAQAFGRNVFADILRWGDSEFLSSLCRAEKLKTEETFMDCLQRFYSLMKINYRCEYVFKNEVIAELRKHYRRKQSLVINEFRLGNSIADLAFFNGESRVYEIKTSYDSPRRLNGQMNDYKCVFDKCYLVVEKEEIDNWWDYDEGLGIIAFCHGPRGKISLEEIRSPKTNEFIDVDVLMTCLRTEEYEYIAKHYAGVQLSECKYMHYEECKAVIQKMNGKMLHDAFLETIKKRNSSFNLLGQAPRELYQICLSMHLNSKQLNYITRSLNNKIF